jgi:nucleotide-binding universal stress UspA family protein
VAYVGRNPKKMLVAIDGSKCSMLAAAYAISIALKNNSQLIVLHVLFSQLEYAYSHHLLGFVTPSEMKNEIEATRMKANQWFKILENKINKNDPSMKNSLITDFLVTDMSVPRAIVNYAEDHDIDLIVVGSRGKSDLKRMLLGSVASSVVNYSSCPVLIIK